MSIQHKLNLAVIYLGIFSIFFLAHPVHAFSDLNTNGIDDATEDEVLVTTEQNLAPGEYAFNNLTIKSGVYINVLGDHASESQLGVKIIAKNITIESGAILYGMGSGYCAGPLPQFCNGGKLIIESENLILNGGISEEGHFAAPGGVVSIRTDSFSGVGAISVQGGKRYCTANCLPPGPGGHIDITYKDSTWTGQAIASAGLFCDSGGCYPMGVNGYATIFKSSNSDLLIVGDYAFDNSLGDIHTMTVSAGSSVHIAGSASGSIETINLNPRSHLYLDDSSGANISMLNVLGNFDAEDQATLHVLANAVDTINTLNVTGIAVFDPLHKLKIDTINITDKGKVTSVELHDLKLDITNLNISSTASLSTEGRGECSGAYSTSLRRQYCAGTGIEINVKNLVVSGMISSRGEHSTNSGNINIKVDKIAGTGLVISKGGMRVCSGACMGPGQGGDITVRYKDKSEWNGTFNVEGGDPDGLPGILTFGDQCDANAASNIMFLPGIMGSRLYENNEEVWFSLSSTKQEKILLNDHGKTLSDVYTKDDFQSSSEWEDETGIIDEAIGANIYKSFIHDLYEWKNTEKIINDYAFIPYDWRLSLEDIINGGAVANGNLFYGPTTMGGKYIIHKLEDLAANSNSCRVTIVAHSNGGLVAKYLIHQLQTENPELASKVDKLILVASPQAGTPESIVSILHGVSMGYGAVMKSKIARHLVNNFPVVYNLLPSSAYFQSADTNMNPLVSFGENALFNKDRSLYGDTINTQAEIKDYLLGGDGRSQPEFGDLLNPEIGNRELYDQSVDTHAIIDNWQPPESLKIIQVAGWGEETISNIEYKTYAERVCEFGICGPRDYISYKVHKVIDGDATVVEPSALWMSPENNSNIERWWVDLQRYNSINFRIKNLNLKREHKDITEVDSLRKFIKANVLGNNYSDSENILINHQPETTQEARLHFQLHSPLYLGILDAEGRYTGIDPVTGEIKQEIPDTTFEQVGEVQFLSVPYGVHFTLQLRGYGAGSFALDVDEVLGNDELESTSFEALPTTDATLATMDIGTDFKAGESVLQVDADGDGKADITISPNNKDRVIYEEKKTAPPIPVPAPIVSVVNIFTNLNIASVINNTDTTTPASPEPVDSNTVFKANQSDITNAPKIDTPVATENNLIISLVEKQNEFTPVVNEPVIPITDQAISRLEAAALSGFAIDSHLTWIAFGIIILILLGFKFIKK